MAADPPDDPSTGKIDAGAQDEVIPSLSQESAPEPQEVIAGATTQSADPPPEPESLTEANFTGRIHPERHRTVGPHRAWCDCGTWCYPAPGSPCWCCDETLTARSLPQELAPCCRAVWPRLDECPTHRWRLHAHPRLVIWAQVAQSLPWEEPATSITP